MLRSITKLCALLCLASCAWSEPQGPTQVGSLVFRVPEGWNRTDSQGTIALTPPDIPEGQTAFISIQPAEELKTDLRTWFDQRWAELKGDAKVMDGGEIKAQRAGAGYDAVYTFAKLRNKDQAILYVLFLAAGVEQQVRPILYATSDEGLLHRYEQALGEFLRSLAFTSLQPPQTTPKATAPATPANDGLSPSFTWGDIPAPSGSAGLSGIYHMQDLGASMSVISGTAVTSIEHTYWCFFPDGRCYYSMPAEGLENFNYDYLLQQNNGFCCTYKMEGDNGIITWGGKDHPTFGFRRVGKALTIKRDSDRYELLDPCDGLKLNGTFKRYDWQGEYSPKAGITFSSDGTFVDEGFLHGAVSMWWWADRGFVDAEFLPGRGTYHVASNSLALLYDDGRKLRTNFHLADEVAKDNVTAFLINTYRFVLVK